MGIRLDCLRYTQKRWFLSFRIASGYNSALYLWAHHCLINVISCFLDQSRTIFIFRTTQRKLSSYTIKTPAPLKLCHQVHSVYHLCINTVTIAGLLKSLISISTTAHLPHTDARSQYIVNLRGVKFHLTSASNCSHID